MLLDNLIELASPRPRNQVPEQTYTLSEVVSLLSGTTISGETVTAETSKTIATAYRCGNIISDDVAKMPLQTFRRLSQRNTERVYPDVRIRNLSYLLEVRPNRWMTPFVFQKTAMNWLIYWGNAYIWQPPNLREMFLLASSRTYPDFPDGQRVFRTVWSNGQRQTLPDVEVLHLMINSVDGLYGRSVIEYARETIGRQLGAHKAQAKFSAQGLNASGILWSSGELDKTARKKVREEFEAVASGSDNAYRVVVADNKFTKFEPISMKASDMQFLEGMQATDKDIANFFGLPLYKLNQGKEAYNSNEQQNLDYLNTTLDPYLVQWEQGAAANWLPLQDQGSTFCRFNRSVVLRTDAKSRAEVMNSRIMSGQLSPNEARAIEDESSYQGGDDHWMPSNMVKIGGNNASNPAP